MEMLEAEGFEGFESRTQKKKVKMLSAGSMNTIINARC
jgi:hypothetical protein